MSLRISPALALTCGAALMTVLSGCPGDDPEVTTDSGTTTDNGTTTMITTTPMTTPATTEPATTDASAEGSTTVVLDGTSTGEPMTSSSSDSGSSSSSSSGPGSSSGGPTDCGNGAIDAGEDCDSGDVGGVVCADQGFDDGVIACDDATCAFDVSGCFFVESLQNDNGMCDANELGCTDPTGTGGNPQDMLECYEFTLTPPVDVTVVQYSIGASVPLPDAVDLLVTEWAGPGNVPGMVLDQIPLDPLTDIVAGPYDFVLPTPVNVTSAGFCVGFHGEDPMDGFRVDFTDADGTGESYLQADGCGLAVATELTTAMIPGNYCIRPTITSPNP